ncbi:MAG: S-adenosylmethionine:tRNA ribosyltransferase-isomerase [Actinomycetes bacterium]
MSTLTFDVPPELAATAPPESRGLARDDVRLLVAAPSGVQHRAFHQITSALSPGDVVVVNTSATLPAAVGGVRRDGSPVVVHFANPATERAWVVELRRADGSGPTGDASIGEHIALPGGIDLEVIGRRGRFAQALLIAEGPVEGFLARFGRPITYSYVRDRWPLSAYQTVFAREPGSAEMPSAGRPFTAELVTDLVTAGVVVAPIVLHTSVSSPEAHEPPVAERFRVPEGTARVVNSARRAGGRVVAVGTTVTRALETVASTDGAVSPGSGWTDLVLGSNRPARVVNGLITGWHEPGASHLHLLTAVAGADLVQRAYDEALAAGYLWHEFGDSCLLLP